MTKRALFSSASDDWHTPKAVYQTLDAEFRFDFDPCPAKPTFDGLAIEWGRCNFVNPPYSDLKAWVAKAFSEALQGKTVVMLIPSRTDTSAWHDFVMKADEIRFIRGRLYFDDGRGGEGRAPFPSAIVVFRGKHAPRAPMSARIREAFASVKRFVSSNPATLGSDVFQPGKADA